MIKELIELNRSYRRFYQDKAVDMQTLKELIDLARLAPSGSNVQALRYILSNTKELNDKINDSLRWAAYIKDWNSPEEGEKPSAFIVMLRDTSLGRSFPQDAGFAAQCILLGAVEKGLGGCFIMNIKKESLRDVLNIEEKYDIESVIAIGHPKEKVIIEVVGASGDVKYWRDDNNVHHVPKRSLDEIIL
jgi:nitroreductase